MSWEDVGGGRWPAPRAARSAGFRPKGEDPWYLVRPEWTLEEFGLRPEADWSAEEFGDDVAPLRPAHRPQSGVWDDWTENRAFGDFRKPRPGFEWEAPADPVERKREVARMKRASAKREQARREAAGRARAASYAPPAPEPAPYPPRPTKALPGAVQAAAVVAVPPELTMQEWAEIRRQVFPLAEARGLDTGELAREIGRGFVRARASRSAGAVKFAMAVFRKAASRPGLAS